MAVSRIIRSLLLLLIPLTPLLPGQTEDTPIFEQRGATIKEGQKEIIEKALAMRKKVSAISREEIGKQMLEPLPEAIQLPPPLARVMTGEEIAKHAWKANLRVGYCYKCKSCDDWHINLAGGYAIAPNVIATCDHVLDTKTKIRDGFLVAFDHEGEIACGVAVLARSDAMDTAIIKVAGADFTPVPLNPDVKQGSSSHCFSYPLRQQGFFSSGVINRFFWNDSYRGEDRDSIDALCHLRVNYSNDWAPGSSGSPLFDSSGNVTGHVSTITGLGGGAGKPALLVLHEGIPARSVRRLAETLEAPGEIKRLANVRSADPGNPAKDETPGES